MEPQPKPQVPYIIQEKVNRMRALQGTLQQINLQRQRFQLDLADSKKAIETLSSTNPDVLVFKSIGAGYIIGKTLDEALVELTERVTFVALRGETLLKQEESLTKRVESLAKEIQADVEGLGLRPA